ncbi:MAG: ABC transporter ATP-binding protein [Spirochaetia bacterium]|nr:ABC transporter ATP-binding protein [Spirochaetia bacterium]
MLTVKDLVKHYPLKAGRFSTSADKIHALNGVSFTLGKKQTLGIVGESGCGKSTLAKTILGIQNPDSGSITLEPKETKMQYIFQDPYLSLNPKMQVKDIITEPLLAAKMITKSEIPDEAEHLLELVGLPKDWGSKYPHEFSGGQRQRICIGRAISSRPGIVICDEPVSSLDVSIQSQILNLLLELQDKLEISYIFIAHNIAVVRYMSDTVSVLYAGYIVESAPPQELYANPMHPYTKLLLSVVPEIGKNKRIFEQKITGEVPDLIHMEAGCPFYSRCPVHKEICRKANPQLKPGEKNDHSCACWLYQ